MCVCVCVCVCVSCVRGLSSHVCIVCACVCVFACMFVVACMCAHLYIYIYSITTRILILCFFYVLQIAGADVEFELRRAAELCEILEAAALRGDMGTVIDTTHLTIEQTVDNIWEQVHKHK